MVGRVLFAMFLIFGAAVAAMVLMMLVVDATAWCIRKWDDRDRRKRLEQLRAKYEAYDARAKAAERYAQWLGVWAEAAAEIQALPEIEPNRRIA